MTTPRRSPPSTDFASAAMVRVLAQGMRELGLRPEAALAAGADQRATVPLDDKRLLVRTAVEQGGWGCLPLLGRGLHRHAQEPTHLALTGALNAADLFARWARLEQYIHSRHRVEMQALSDGEALLVHRARTGLPPPLLAESLVVLGVLAALLEAIGAHRVAAWIGPVPVYPEPDADALTALGTGSTPDTPTGRVWRMVWQSPNASRPTDPAADLAPPTLDPPQAWPAVAQRCFRALGKDLMAPPSLPELADALGEAPRSLQRHLSGAGLSYTRVLSEARCRSASAWLVRTTTPIAEVGFISGYADQPHFTRDFRHRVGLTPLRFRESFFQTPAR